MTCLTGGKRCDLMLISCHAPHERGNRVLTKRYGQQFLDAIPKCPVEVV